MSVSPRRGQGLFLIATVGMIVCLLLLINLSFKIIELFNMLFTASSLLCPMLAFFYAFALRDCTVREQRHILNMALLALYLFSIGVFLLIHLPAGEYASVNPAYKIIFEEIPRKFFANTLAFGLCFYLPHFLLVPKLNASKIEPNIAVILALAGGLGFFFVDFYFLFAEPSLQFFQHIITDSFLVCFSLLLSGMVLFLLLTLRQNQRRDSSDNSESKFPLLDYLTAFILIMMLICTACEYRLVNLFGKWSLTANSLLFPFALMGSSLVYELFGFKAIFRMIAVLLVGQLCFELLLILAVLLPSPSFFNLNPFYLVVLPKRIPAELLSTVIIFLANAYFLQKLRERKLFANVTARLFFANFCTQIIVCCVSYATIFYGVVNYLKLFELAKNAWVYKNVLGLVSLPFLVWCLKRLEETVKMPNMAFHQEDAIINPN